MGEDELSANQYTAGDFLFRFIFESSPWFRRIDGCDRVHFLLSEDHLRTYAFWFHTYIYINII